MRPREEDSPEPSSELPRLVEKLPAEEEEEAVEGEVKEEEAEEAVEEEKEETVVCGVKGEGKAGCWWEEGPG